MAEDWNFFNLTFVWMKDTERQIDRKIFSTWKDLAGAASKLQSMPKNGVLSFCLTVFLSFLSFCLSVFLLFCCSVFLSFLRLFAFLFFYLSCLSVFSVFLSFCLSVFPEAFCLSVFLSSPFKSCAGSKLQSLPCKPIHQPAHLRYKQK